jgi:hypothetical protein
MLYPKQGIIEYKSVSSVVIGTNRKVATENLSSVKGIKINIHNW